LKWAMPLGNPCSFLNVFNLETLLIGYFVAAHYFNAQAILSFRHFTPRTLWTDKTPRQC
jgi:hypothetical protein